MVVGEFTQETDLLVIGGGPAGYSTAFRAAQLGVKTVLVDSRDALGGVCLHEGCVPSKTLLHIADCVNAPGASAAFGVNFAKPRIDIARVRQWVTQTVTKLAGGLDTLCRKHGVERLVGEARFEDSRHAALRGGAVPRVKFRRAVIATGSRPKPLSGMPRSESILNPAQALRLDEIPAKLLVVGTDYMAVELATIYAALGSLVTLACEESALLPEADPDLVRPMARRLQERLHRVLPGTRVTGLEAVNGGVTAQLGDAEAAAAFDRTIVSNGLEANIDSLDLAKTTVKLNEGGFIAVDNQLRTSDPRVFAVGDVTGHPLLAAKAIHQGRVAAEVISGADSVYDARAVPMVVFSDPEIAWCGLTEAQARVGGMPVEVSRIPWGASGRVSGMGRTDGMTKVIFDPESQLVLGVGMVGRGAAEMIAEGCLALEMGAVLTDLASTIHPHPTASELISDAAAQILHARAQTT